MARRRLAGRDDVLRCRLGDAFVAGADGRLPLVKPWKWGCK